MTLPDPRLTDLVSRWRERADGDMSGWAAFEACMLEDRALLARAWETSDDAFAMLLALWGMHAETEHEATVALTQALSFCPAFAELAETQARCPPGSNYNGPSLFRFNRLAQTARRALREATAQERAALDRRLCEAIRSVVPDLRALEDHGEPALATSADTNRSRPSLSCGARVRLCHRPGTWGTVSRVSWNTRFRCWTYWLEGDPTRRKAEDLVEERGPAAT